MAKDDTQTAGLFSKVVKFVRNPGTNWSDLDHKESDRESSYSKQALKEMIERKRRNDFVRKREFDMLRKLRRREAVGEQSGDGAARPSFFQSSMPSKPDDRAMTLKKIDEIEAQMSMQWWKTKHGSNNSSLPPSSGFPNSAVQQGATPSTVLQNQAAANARTHAHAYARTAPGDLENPPASMPVAAAAAAAAPAKPAAVPAAPAAAAAAPKTPLMGGLAAAYEGGATGFSASKLFALEVDEVQHDPELEEAAIRFANGDDAGAEAGLLEALSLRGTRNEHDETWFTVFDLYRATGQQVKFESLAIDFASKFNRSAPMWFSIPEMVSRMPSEAAAKGVVLKADWRSPAIVGTQSVAALSAALAKAQMPWCLDWTALKQIDAAAVQPLCKIFAGWAELPVQLRFIAAANLDEVLAQGTPSGVRETHHDAWKLRLECHRITHRPDEFELAALDFCVTFEVSPPAWESARCEYKSLDADGGSGLGQTIIGEAVRDSVQSDLSSYDTLSGNTTAQPTALVAVELSGQIQGDAVAALDKLEARVVGADIMVISCAKLIRVDFSAAGTMLNWVSARQAEGRAVQFSDVHRLVAAFFHVIGISEHAKVVSRTD